MLDDGWLQWNIKKNCSRSSKGGFAFSKKLQFSRWINIFSLDASSKKRIKQIFIVIAAPFILKTARTCPFFRLFGMRCDEEGWQPGRCLGWRLEGYTKEQANEGRRKNATRSNQFSDYTCEWANESDVEKATKMRFERFAASSGHIRCFYFSHDVMAVDSQWCLWVEVSFEVVKEAFRVCFSAPSVGKLDKLSCVVTEWSYFCCSCQKRAQLSAHRKAFAFCRLAPITISTENVTTTVLDSTELSPERK